MNHPAGRSRGHTTRSIDRDGVVRTHARQGFSVVHVVSLLVSMVAVGLLVWVWQGNKEADTTPRESRSPTTARQTNSLPSSSPIPKGATLRPASQGRAATAPTPAAVLEDAAGKESPDEPAKPDEENVEAPLQNEPGKARSGILVFPAPGTKRLKAGLVVPEEFALPPGYVRHYQADDKGRMLRPILMFHPDYELVDASGQPIPMPADRVVPPELAPPGLPQEKLEIPKDAYADRDAPGTEPGQTSVEEDDAGELP